MISLEELHREADQFKPSLQKLFQKSLPELRAQAFDVSLRLSSSKVFFAPIYVSNQCAATCNYCAFHRGSGITRKTSSSEEAQQEAQYLADEGYHAAYCLTGSLPAGNISKVKSMTELNARGLRAIYKAGLFPALESSPFTRDNFCELLDVVDGNGRFVLFQECYDEKTYRETHGADPYKGNPQARLEQLELAIEAGWPEIGIGVLLGLYSDLVTELACLAAHARRLLYRGARIVTISVPRQNPGTGVVQHSRCDDDEFERAVLALRITCPESPIVLTGRETPEMRDRLYRATEIWGVRGATEPGGYTVRPSPKDGQFSLRDLRSIDEILESNS